MKPMLLLRKARFVFAALALFCVAYLGVSLWRTSAINQNKKQEVKQKFNARVRDGVGYEVKFAGRSKDKDNVRSSINSLAHFIRLRSGSEMSGRVKNRLADMEASTLNGNSRRITIDELSDILATTALERVATLSDSEVERAAVTLGGFDAPDLPDAFRRGRDKVKLRASKHSDLTREEFVSQVKAIRDADKSSSAIFKGAARNAAAAEVKNRIGYLTEAVPEQFSETDGLTPAQAVLLTYSVVSDDLLTNSETNLRKIMKAEQEAVSKAIGGSYPSPDGHFAYGINGYRFSTPLDITFDEQTLNILLNHIAERSMQR
ncbi:MAG: hypothetical protein MSG64_18880 [Pyrinomonadaceae bacterium MAG19_C2-C3]|nr:hypothetical protein [Pyrinomonadaceae bacterium MAG19_C2-C3]